MPTIHDLPPEEQEKFLNYHKYIGKTDTLFILDWQSNWMYNHPFALQQDIKEATIQALINREIEIHGR